MNVGAGLVDVVAYHNGVAMTADPTLAGTDQTYCYNPTTGVLTLFSKDFSPFAIKYKIPVTSVSLPAEAAAYVGSTTPLTATILPANAFNKFVTWTTSDASVATVNDGVVTGVAEGTATITATTIDGGYTASCVVTVTTALTVNTVQELVAALADPNVGDMILVASGTYNFETVEAAGASIVIDKPLTIRAENPENKPVFNIPITSNGKSPDSYIRHGVEIKSNNVTLENLKFSVNPANVSTGNLVQIDQKAASGSTVEEKYYSDITINGCEFKGSDHCIATMGKDVTIKNCILDESTADDQGNIIYVWSSAGALTIQNNTFIGKANKKHGISFYQQSGAAQEILGDVTISGNSFNDVYKGVVLESMPTWSGSAISIKDNVFTDIYGENVTVVTGTFTNCTMNVSGNVFSTPSRVDKVSSVLQNDKSLAVTADNNYWGVAAPEKSVVIKGTVTATVYYTDSAKTATANWE